MSDYQNVRATIDARIANLQTELTTLTKVKAELSGIPDDAISFSRPRGRPGQTVRLLMEANRPTKGKAKAGVKFGAVKRGPGRPKKNQ